MDNEQIRTFIAIELPQDFKDNLREFQSKLKARQQNFIKWVDPGLMHLTLKFLGAQSPKQIETIKSALGISASSCSPFYIGAGQPGFFPGLRNVRIYWIGLSGDLDRLVSLQKNVEDLLADKGFQRETRAFAAHLTLARLKDECSMQNRSSFVKSVQGVSFPTGYSFVVDRISLMKSTLTPKGPHYSTLAEYKFAV